MLKTALSTCLFFILASCSEQIDIDLPAHEAKPVINCLFSSDSLMRIYLSRSTNHKEKITNEMNIKEVHIYENRIEIEPETYVADSLLIISYRAKPTTTYSIELLSDSEERIVASDSLPEKPQFHVVDFRPKVGFDSEGYEFSEITIEVVDINPVAGDYYELSVVSSHSQLGLVKNYVWSNDVIITDEGDADFYYYNLLFSDKLFNGQRVILKCFIGYDDSDEEAYVCLRSISPSYYRYKKSIMRHFANQEGDVWTGSGNPVNVYSNVEGGYGIFAGFQEDTDTIYLNK